MLEDPGRGPMNQDIIASLKGLVMSEGVSGNISRTFSTTSSIEVNYVTRRGTSLVCLCPLIAIT